MKKPTFEQFYKALTDQEIENLAARANTSTQYLYQLATRRRRAGASVSARLKAADSRITDSMLRPDLYG
jgi:hypothetical protein